MNYHRLDRAGLERLTYTYLGDWIARQRHALEAGESGADGRLIAAEALQRKLKLILEGEPPYNVFVRWKPVEAQPLGWDPDLNDGVRANVWPFVQADVLRHKPNVKWTKDRGKNPPGEPWGPERHNRYEDLPGEHKLKDERGKPHPAPHERDQAKGTGSDPSRRRGVEGRMRTTERAPIDTNDALVRSLVEPIVEGVRPLRVILFGSRAAGTARPDSDVDLLVVMPDGTDCRRMMTEASLHLPLDRHVDVDLLVATPEVLARHRDNPGLVYRQILRTGRDIYVAPRP